jgi:hypothetical protein
MVFNKQEMIDVAADIIEDNSEVTAYEALAIAEDIYAQWDAVFGAFDTYEDYQKHQLGFFDKQYDLAL